ncbi:hypothetical protein ASG47_09555 [Devosia sp. Leaf420]|nr:hypothetical protein ASG47_09555 [Devosia sp. Leaf420]
MAYYSQLSAWGYAYGALALGVVTQETLSGRTANRFFINQSGVFEPDDLATVSLALMNFDLEARRDANGNDIGYHAISEYHREAFELVGANIDAWTPTRALNELDEEDRGALWISLLTSGELSSGASLLQPLPWLELNPNETGAQALERLAQYAWDLGYASLEGLLGDSGELGGFERSIGDGKLIALMNTPDVGTGTAFADTLMGYAGNDTLYGGYGADRLYGGQGDDQLWSGAMESDGFHSSDDDADWLVGGTGHDHYHGGGGTVFALVDDYWTELGQFGDLNPEVTSQVDHIFDEDGIGSIYYPSAYFDDAQGYFYSVWFETGTITSFAASSDRWANNASSFYTELSDGTRMYAFLLDLYPDDGVNALDLVLAQHSEYVTVSYVIRNFYQGDFGILIDGYGEMRNAPPSGNGAGDILQGTADSDTLIGGALNDNIVGGAGNDILVGNNGDDRIWGHAGDDTIIGGAGGDYMDGGDGFDTVSYASAGAGIYIHSGNPQANTGDAAGDRILNFEAIRGSEHADELILVENGAYVFGGGGDDTVTLAGDGGFVFGESGHDSVFGSGGADSIYGDAGDDTLFGYGGDDLIEGGADNDTVYGGSGRDKLNGGSGNDYLYGDADDDELYGGDGTDELFGGMGVDTLDGGRGNDWLVGGAGADTFVFDGTFGTDGVADFELGVDSLRISNHAGLTFDSIIDASNEWGGNSWLNVGGNTIVLYGVALSNISSEYLLIA